LPLILRHWTTRPGLAVSVVGTIAVGIAAALGAFAALDALALRALPWPDANRLAAVHAVLPDERGNPGMVATWNRAPITWEAWEGLQRSPAFEEVGVWMSGRQILDMPGADGRLRSEAVEILHVSTTYLSLLGAQPRIGRLFTQAEDADIGTDAVVLSHSTWLRLFGGRADVIGRAVTIRPALQFAGSRKTVVGVLPSGFLFPEGRPALVLPIGLQSWNARFNERGFLRGLARLAPGLTADTATAMTEAVVRGREPPERRTARIVPLREELVGRFVPSFWLLFGGSAIVLAISLTVAAGLLLDDVISRRQEIAIRLALGATRRRLVAQVLTEQLTLGAVATSAGVVISPVIRDGLIRTVGLEVPHLAAVGLDARVASATVFVSLMTLVVLGLVATRSVSSSKPGSGGLTASHATRRRTLTEKTVFGAVLALTVALTSGAGIFADAMLRVRSQPVGFNPDGLVVIGIKPAQVRSTVPERPAVAGDGNQPYGLPAVRSPLLERPIEALEARVALTSWLHTAILVDHLATLPRVEGVAGVLTVPFGGGWQEAQITPDLDPAGGVYDVQVQAVTPSYFEVMSIPVLSGRALRADDRGMRRVVVSEEFRRRFLRGDGVGATFVRDNRRYVVVGVVGNVSQLSFADESLPCYYVLDATVANVNHLVIRTAGDPGACLSALREAIGEYNPHLLVTSTSTMRDLLALALAEEALRARTFVAFCGMSILLAAAGLFSLLRRQITDRHREVGVRLALGARPRHVYLLVLKQAGHSVLVGLVGGLLGSLLVLRAIAALVGEVSADTPAALALAMAVMLLVALLATIGPARRALRIDPIRALRD
jgi:putative ABC transport system permease protein